MPVFFLLEVEDSTLLWKEHREAMADVLSAIDAIARASIKEHGGKIIKHRGDSIFAFFEGGDPLASAIEIQNAVAKENWGEIGELLIRMALHAGGAEKRGDDYTGPAVSRAAHILDIAWGGQILITPEALRECPLPAGAGLQDLGAHLLKDLNHPQPIQMVVAGGSARKEFPPLRSLSNRPHNLPAQSTPFVGREEELSRITQMLEEDDCRLVTLLGPGGIGKTRLAIQAASERSDGFAHGAYFVDLSPLASADLLVSAMAQSLRFNFFGEEEPRAQLLKYLREKQLLLVMDNFEHVLEGATLIYSILNEAPKVKLIATSREKLKLQGERILEIHGMAVPEDGTQDIESLSAVRLFLQTAQRVSPAFSLSEEDKPVVSRICRLLAGMPLGIELAASWVRTLSCGELADEIELNMDFLATPLRDMPERHRSLRAVFEYSWNLLSEYEKSSLKKISVFKGGFESDAARTVAGAPLPILELLVSKSLLKKNPAGRYDIHAAVRQYAAERLADNAGERERVSSQHAQYYSEALSSRTGDLKGRKQDEAVAALSRDIENIRTAWQRHVDQQNEEEIEKSLHPLFLLYRTLSWFREGESAFTKAVQVLNRNGVVAKMLLARQGVLCRLLSRYEEAKSLLLEALSFFRDIGKREELAFCLSGLGFIEYRMGKYSEADKLIREGLSIYRQLNDRFECAMSLTDLGDLSWETGEYARSEKLYDEGSAIFHDIGNKYGMARTVSARGLVAIARGEYEKARDLFGEGLAIANEINSPRQVMTSQYHLGCVAFLLGRLPEARELLEESLALSREIGDQLFAGTSLEDLGGVAQQMGEPEKAKELFKASLITFREIRDNWGIASSLNSLAGVLMESNDLASARSCLKEGLSAASEMQATPLVGEILIGIACLLEKEGKKDAALELASTAFNNPTVAKRAKDKAALLLERYGLKAGATKDGSSAQSGGDIPEMAKRALLLLAGAG